MLLDQDANSIPREAHLKRWFLVGGAVGFLLALLLAFGLHYDAVSSGVVLALWPLAMVQLIDPKTIGAKIAVGSVAYGSNFLIYGLVGAGIGFVANRLLELRRHR
jgi:hypothetical protein